MTVSKNAVVNVLYRDILVYCQTVFQMKLSSIQAS